jgi:hypothetical protein
MTASLGQHQPHPARHAASRPSPHLLPPPLCPPSGGRSNDQTFTERPLSAALPATMRVSCIYTSHAAAARLTAACATRPAASAAATHRPFAPCTAGVLLVAPKFWSPAARPQPARPAQPPPTRLSPRLPPLPRPAICALPHVHTEALRHISRRCWYGRPGARPSRCRLEPGPCRFPPRPCAPPCYPSRARAACAATPGVPPPLLTRAPPRAAETCHGFSGCTLTPPCELHAARVRAPAVAPHHPQTLGPRISPPIFCAGGWSVWPYL